MRELVRTNDIVLVSAVGRAARWRQHPSSGAGPEHEHPIEGSLGVIPRRILVHEDDNRAARQLLADAGLAHELRADD